MTRADGSTGWLTATALAGAAWNLFGLYQLISGLTSSGQAAMAVHLTQQQADLYFGLPTWMSAAFALGAGAGLVGCCLLLARRRAAWPVLAASLAGYVALFAGDVAHGVFTAIPQQLPILSTVVIIAVGLAVTARLTLWRGMLR